MTEFYFLIKGRKPGVGDYFKIYPHNPEIAYAVWESKQLIKELIEMQRGWCELLSPTESVETYPLDTNVSVRDDVSVARNPNRE